MGAAIIDFYLKKRVLERVPASSQSIETHLNAAQGALEVAKLVEKSHPNQAISLTYDGVLGLALAYLQARGLRITSGQGHHTAALEVLEEELLAGNKNLADPMFELRSARVEVTYSADVPDYSLDEVGEWLQFASGLQKVVKHRLDGRIVPY